MVHTRTKILAAISGGVFMLSLLVFVGFQYTLTKYKADLVVQEKKILDARTQESRLASMEKLIHETESERAQLAGLILTDEGVVDFLALIETLGKEQGVTLATQSLNVVPDKDTFEELQMHLSATGAERDILDVLRLLEALPYRSNVESVTLSKMSGDEKINVWQATFDLRVTKYKKK